MFGLFKKKPIEEKYGRDNYLRNPDHYGTTEDQWILALSSVFIEYKQIETVNDDARHDLLMGYADNKFGMLDKRIINDDFDLKTVKKIEKRLSKLTNCWPSDHECDLFDVINAKSKEDVEELANEDYEDSIYDVNRLRFIWQQKEVFANGFNYRIGLIAETMWQIRLAVLTDVISVMEAWQYLYKLTDLIRPMLTLFTNWEEYLANLQLFYTLKQYGIPLSDFHKAVICLNKAKDSPLNKIPYELGLNKNEPYPLTTCSYYIEPRYKKKKDPVFLQFVKLFNQEDKQPLWEMLDAFDKADSDYYLPTIIRAVTSKRFDEEDIIELPQLYPDVHYSYLFRGNYLTSLAWGARDGGYGHVAEEENDRLFDERIAYALDDYKKAYEINPDDPNVWAELIKVLEHSEREEAEGEIKYIAKRIAKEALDSPLCTRTVASIFDDQWDDEGIYIASQKAIEWVKKVIQGTQYGDVSRLIAFITTEDRYYGLWSDEDDEDEEERDDEDRDDEDRDSGDQEDEDQEDTKADVMIRDENLTKELSPLFDELLENIHKDPCRIASQLAFWCIERNDTERLRALGRTMKPGYYTKKPLFNYYSNRKVVWVMNWIRMI